MPPASARPEAKNIVARTANKKPIKVRWLGLIRGKRKSKEWNALIGRSDFEAITLCMGLFPDQKVTDESEMIQNKLI